MLDRTPKTRREWAELIANQFVVDAVDAIEEGISRGETLARTPQRHVVDDEVIRAIANLIEPHLGGSRGSSDEDYDAAQFARELAERIAALPAFDDEESYQIGVLEGYERAVQDIDLLTGGDGEYRYCTNHDPERHCPDPEAMKAKIAERFAAVRLKTKGEE